ncbi:nitronate monooxygenase [Deinococcus taeanensis]|uniref:nitronate monooxygenase n=1 Tax=Deinococcus taeanensis TaxID=2737050 RepID=UPI001CDBE610|nr:nitronate monooxygenase [Deinococcus taeanensis]UBV43646.1 nitronate monooxygenase [Deinococcus taeanensis]
MNGPQSWPAFRASLRVPLVLAPMAGGTGTPALAAAVSAAGALGSLGGAYLTPDALRGAIREVRALTPGPLMVNLFAPQPIPAVTGEEVRRAAAELTPFHERHGLPPAHLPETVQEAFEAQLEVVLVERPEVFSFAFGRLAPDVLTSLRARGILTVGTATSVAEALDLQSDGVDAVTVQGGPAGGHRGGWREDALADTLTLTRAAAAQLRVPVIAAGGLMSAADLRAVLAAGAALAQCGTAFLRAQEAGTPGAYRAALQAGTRDTVLTRAYSGRPARGLRTTLTDVVASPLPFPLQNALTRPLRAAGARRDDPEVLSLWAGEGYRRGLTGTAAQIVAHLTP